MIKSIIVDDEEGGRISLNNQLKENCPEVEVLALCDTLSTAIANIKKYKPDVVFLDIQLRNEIGFDLLKKIDKIDFEVVFVTAYDKYAIKAFRFSAIDYLLKPVDPEELKKAVKKVENKHSDKHSYRQFENFLHNQQLTNLGAKKIALPTTDGLVFIEVRDIIRCDADDNYTMFFFKNGKKFMVARTIKDFEELLDDFGFFRIHQSHLVNLNEVKQFVRDEGGYVIMTDESKIPVSRRKKDELLNHLPGIERKN